MDIRKASVCTSDYLYPLVALDIWQKGHTHYTIADIGGGDLRHRDLFKIHENYIVIERGEIYKHTVAEYPAMILTSKEGFPDCMLCYPYDLKRSIAIAMFSLTMSDLSGSPQYMNDEVIKWLSRFAGVYITFWDGDFNAYLKYDEIFSYKECIYKLNDGMQLMYYSN